MTTDSNPLSDEMEAMLRPIAAAVGLTYEQICRDFDDARYSITRGALLELYRAQPRRRSHIDSVCPSCGSLGHCEHPDPYLQTR